MAAIKATEDVKHLLDEIREVRAFKNKCIDEEKRLVQLLYNQVNEHDEIFDVDADGVKIDLATWKYSADSVRFDGKRFKEEHKEMYDQYSVKQLGSRTLRIKE